MGDPELTQEVPNSSPAPRKRIRLVWTLLAVLLATSLIPLLVTAFALIDINREALESTRREYELQVATSIASRLDAALGAGLRRVSRAGDELLPSIRIGRSGARVRVQTARSVLRPYLSDEMLLVRHISPTGKVAEAGDLEGWDTEEIQKILFNAFAAAAETGGKVVLPVHLHAARGGSVPIPGAVVALPLSKNGRPAGVLAALMDLRETWFQSVETVGADYAVFAMDPRGGLLASANLPEDLEGGAHRRLEIVKRFLNSPVKFKETMPLTLPGRGGSEGTREMLGASAPTDAGWGLFVLLDRSLAYHEVDEMVWQVARWAGFTVALAAIAAVIAAGLVTRPLKALVEGARRLGQGQFEEPVDVRSRSEMGELAETFNRMAEEIRNQITELHDAAETNRQLLLGSIRSLAAAIDEKDPYTRGHSERVHRYAVAIAKQMGLSESQIRDVTVGALLHDVGKIGIEDAILRKPASLTDQEFEIMKRHPEKGAHIMGAIPQMQPILGAIRNHHERWTGGGYPDDLKGEEIPLLARIVQVADAFDAMITTRPYQRAMKPEAGLARIRELAGIVFDPTVVEAFEQAWMAGEFRVESRTPARAEEHSLVGAGS